METNTMSAAEQELHAILVGIAQEHGTGVATSVVRALLAAVQEGRIDGSEHGSQEEYDDAQNQWVLVPLATYKGCMMGQMAQALNSWGDDDLPALPVWTEYHHNEDTLSPLERHVLDVRPGHTPATSPPLADLQSWLTVILAI